MRYVPPEGSEHLRGRRGGWLLPEHRRQRYEGTVARFAHRADVVRIRRLRTGFLPHRGRHDVAAERRDGSGPALRLTAREQQKQAASAGGPELPEYEKQGRQVHFVRHGESAQSKEDDPVEGEAEEGSRFGVQDARRSRRAEAGQRDPVRGGALVMARPNSDLVSASYRATNTKPGFCAFVVLPRHHSAAHRQRAEDSVPSLDEGRAGARQRFGDRASDSAARSGHKCAFPGQGECVFQVVIHGIIPYPVAQRLQRQEYKFALRL